MKIKLALVLTIITGIWIFFLNIDLIVKKSIEKYGSEITGTYVGLEGFELSLKEGKASIKRLLIANPEGYSQPYIFELDEISVDIDVVSLATSNIVIENITIKKPSIIFEALSLQQNNIKSLQENIEKNLPQTQKSTSISKEEPQDTKNFFINEFVLSNANIYTYIPNDISQVFPLPSITLNNIDGNPQKQIATVLNKIAEKSFESVASISKQKLQNIANENLEKITNSIKDKISIEGIF